MNWDKLFETHLEHLNLLENNKCTFLYHRYRHTPCGGVSIANSLKNNTSLLILDLAWSHIDTNGGIALAKALETNTALHSLDLEGNNIDVNGGQAFVEMLKTNITLTKFILRYNRVDPKDEEFIENAIKRNINIGNMKKNVSQIYLGFGKKTPFYVKQKLLFNDKLTEQENLKYTNLFLTTLLLEK